MNKQVILITGASSGIGFMTAERLAKMGYRVYGAARRVDKIAPLEPLGVIPVSMDVTDGQSVQAAIRTIMEKEGRIDILINNAGYGSFGAIETVPVEEARRQLEVNVLGMALLTALVLPGMRERKNGRIINISSIAGRMTIPFGGWYNISKYSVEAFSDALRMETKPMGIKVSIIEPGGIKTDWGIIAADHLTENTAGTAYEKPASKEAAILRRGYSSNLLTSPDRVAKTIVRAATARRPRLRYRVGTASTAAIVFRAIIPARWWDALMRWFFC
jgi:NADP-dependent 3-hydroxy acid dehydrogenase YdfG